MEKDRTRFMSKLSPELRVNSPVERRLLAEYGSMFVAKNVTVPTKIVFRDEAEVSEFQTSLLIETATIGGFEMRLQAAAMQDLRRAINDAEEAELSILPRDADSAGRTYGETVELWECRVQPALRHWVSEGRLMQSEAESISAMSPFEQVPAILTLEEKGLCFAKDLSKSIVYSVAPPGTSQHLAMLAFDLKEHNDPQVRMLLEKHRWFQTVVSDLPHFTYLGAVEGELADLGLMKVIASGREFWVPDI